MTPDELAAELYRRQGYLVIASPKQRPLGLISEDKTLSGNGFMDTKLIITEETDKGTWERQDDIAEGLTGLPKGSTWRLFDYRYFYKVEAAD